jgi:hypothetical protein
MYGRGCCGSSHAPKNPRAQSNPSPPFAQPFHHLLLGHSSHRRLLPLLYSLSIVTITVAAACLVVKTIALSLVTFVFACVLEQATLVYRPPPQIGSGASGYTQAAKATPKTGQTANRRICNSEERFAAGCPQKGSGKGSRSKGQKRGGN